MSLSQIFSTAGSAMSAESIRLNLTASNLANAESVGSTQEGTYHARHSLFAPEKPFSDFLSQETASSGVKVTGIVEDQKPLVKRFEPNHPLANKEGYVFYPNVNVVEEMADMISASRSYQSNVQVMLSAKQMIQSALELGRD